MTWPLSPSSFQLLITFPALFLATQAPFHSCATKHFAVPGPLHVLFPPTQVLFLLPSPLHLEGSLFILKVLIYIPLLVQDLPAYCARVLAFHIFWDHTFMSPRLKAQTMFLDVKVSLPDIWTKWGQWVVGARVVFWIRNYGVCQSYHLVTQSHRTFPPTPMCRWALTPACPPEHLSLLCYPVHFPQHFWLGPCRQNWWVSSLDKSIHLLVKRKHCYVYFIAPQSSKHQKASKLWMFDERFAVAAKLLKF